MAEATTSAVFVDCTPDISQMLSPDICAIVPEMTIYDTSPADESELISRMHPYSVVMVYMEFLSQSVLNACSELKAIVYLSTGLATHIDLEEASKLKLRIRNIKGYGDRAVAEHTIALMFAAARRLPEMNQNIRNGEWSLHKGIELQGKTLGIIGLGGIGIEVAGIARSLGMHVIGWNRSGIKSDIPCDYRELDDLMKEADVVSLHLALCDETDGLIDSRRISLMKAGAILVNTARAQLIDEQALMEAVSNGHIIAGLDVFHQEPIPLTSSIVKSSNVVLSAHSGWYTGEAISRLLRMGFETVREEIDLLNREV